VPSIWDGRAPTRPALHLLFPGKEGDLLDAPIDFTGICGVGQISSPCCASVSPTSDSTMF